MFLKSNKKSIFMRLTILYSFLAFILILVASILLYSVLVDNIKQSDRRYVEGEIRNLENILKGRPQKNVLIALHQEVMLEPKARQNYYFIQIKFYNDHVLMETPGIENIDLDNKDKASYISMSHTAVIRGREYKIRMILSVIESKRLIKYYQRNLYIAVFLNLFISIFFGYIITAAGMYPLKKMNRSLVGIDTDELSIRLKVEDLPKELVEITKGINGLLTRVEKAFQRLSQFSSDLAHELRTPLNNIICQTEITLSKPRQKEDYEKVLVSNLHECQKLSSLIDQILFIARAKNPRKHVYKTCVKFRVVINTIVDYFEVLAKEKLITILVEGDENLNVDVGLFKRAIANLLANSIRHTPQKGIITIHAEKSTEDGILISIIDTGTGIDAKDIPHLFDRFYRVSDSRSRDEGGAGLGLAIVKSIMLLHDGKITVSSQVGKGATFKLYFPLSSPNIARL